MSSQEDRDKELLEAFNSRFGTSLSDPDVVKRMLGSPHVRGWYAEYRAERAESQQLPPQWAEAGLTPAQWAQAAPVRQQIRAIRSVAAREIATEAQRFQSRLGAINSRTDKEVGAITTPLVRVLNAGFPDLPLSRQLAVENGPADKRDDRLAVQMAAWRSEAVELLNGGGDPFRGK